MERKLLIRVWAIARDARLHSFSEKTRMRFAHPGLRTESFHVKRMFAVSKRRAIKGRYAVRMGFADLRLGALRAPDPSGVVDGDRLQSDYQGPFTHGHDSRLDIHEFLSRCRQFCNGQALTLARLHYHVNTSGLDRLASDLLGKCRPQQSGSPHDQPSTDPYTSPIFAQF